MNREYRIGVFVNSNEEFSVYEEFIYNLIKERNETIIREIKYRNNFEIQTDKSLYRILKATQSARGHRFDRVYISEYIRDEEIIDSVIIPMTIINKEERFNVFRII